MQRNLDNLIHNAKFSEGTFALNDAQKADILAMVGKGCRENTKAKLARRLEIPLSCWERYGIYSRMTLSDTGANYICGQSWNDEMRTLRECILG
jgi:hypothetical protein